MFLLIPKKVRIETKMTPNQCRTRLNREMEDYTRRPSFVAASEFIKKHKLTSCYFGSTDKTGRTEIFYHRAKKHDGSSAGFYGVISKPDDKAADGTRAVFTGHIRRNIGVMVVAWLWTLVCIALVLALAALKEYVGAGVTGAVMVIGLLLMAYDRSESYIRSYLDTFAKADKKEDDG
ncbi:hypothetical protein SAMN02910447_00566 [Ruminococcus sp. YE71]|uniref:hypothetical protein n=1 Tax=unclassified Ruminococcus TaxID=2608920 RepID=UPI0008863008|nr:MULTISPECIES: hypothetical protein [unclassified Ruminococcus]SDA12267.1 hypothetical protein SAMN02910446_00565 [Ruminococcus sp. YE78]SFW16659.1 hypothetical protein SAMN02910447_00566 [Ruminococcus sp. YE71]